MTARTPQERAPLASFATEAIVRELNSRLVACPRGHAPEILALWPCFRCAVERAAEARRTALPTRDAVARVVETHLVKMPLGTTVTGAACAIADAVLALLRTGGTDEH